MFWTSVVVMLVDHFFKSSLHNLGDVWRSTVDSFREQHEGSWFLIAFPFKIGPNCAWISCMLIYFAVRKEDYTFLFQKRKWDILVFVDTLNLHTLPFRSRQRTCCSTNRRIWPKASFRRQRFWWRCVLIWQNPHLQWSTTGKTCQR